jgi:hypothetical protein
MLVSLEEVQEYLGVQEDFTKAINRASKQVEKIIGRNVIEKTHTEKHEGGVRNLFLKNYPFQEDSIVIKDMTGKEIKPVFTSFEDEGRLTGHFQFPACKVTYVAGIAPDTENVPEDIKKAVLILIAEERNNGADPSKTNESAGDYSKGRNPQFVMDEVHALLSPYKVVM